MTARPPVETATPDPIERARAGLHALAAETGLRMSAIRALAVAEADEDSPEVDSDAVLDALERGESVSVVCGRWHLSRWAVERIRASDGQG
jgi:hypothetical protein